MFKFKKYLRVILGPSSSDAVATLEKKFGKTAVVLQKRYILILAIF